MMSNFSAISGAYKTNPSISDAPDLGIVGRSDGLLDALGTVRAVAPTTAAVLVTGETGTGKELIARAIHGWSFRSDRPLVRVNCASIPRELFESEFFGHAKGAFTGAVRDRIGRFELADGGTLFLDEVCEIPLELQSKLLRVLQENEFERVGEDRSRRVDVRIVAATNRDPIAEIRRGSFREDLYFRLNVVPISVPPLRDRLEDILPLANYFLGEACRRFDRGPFSLQDSHRMALEKYAWPGNVRELRNVIERAVALSVERLIELSGILRQLGEGSRELQSSRYLTEEEFRESERRNVTAALEVAGWKIAGAGGAADLLGIPASTLANRVRTLGISRPGDQRSDFRAE